MPETAQRTAATADEEWLCPMSACVRGWARAAMCSAALHEKRPAGLPSCRGRTRGGRAVRRAGDKRNRATSASRQQVEPGDECDRATSAGRAKPGNWKPGKPENRETMEEKAAGKQRRAPNRRFTAQQAAAALAALLPRPEPSGMPFWMRSDTPVELTPSSFSVSIAAMPQQFSAATLLRRPCAGESQTPGRAHASCSAPGAAG